MMKRINRGKRIAVLLVAVLVTALLGGCAGKLKLASANQDGEYYKAAKTIAADLKNDKRLQAEVLETAGSAENLRLITEGRVQLAVVQSDVAARTYLAPDADKSYSAIGALYTEVCHIIVRADSEIQSVADLAGKRVSIGSRESGTESNALDLLGVYGITGTDADLQNLSYSNASVALMYDDIDAMFCTGNMGMTAIQTLSDQTEIRFLPITEQDLAQMNRAANAYHLTVIPKGTYTGQTEDVPAISVSAMLIAGNKVDNSTARKIAETLVNKRTALPQTSHVPEDQTPSFIVTNIPIPFHAGAEGFYKESGLLP